MKSFISLVCIALISTPAFAVETTTGSFSSPAIFAKSRSEALIATSTHYALPHEDMTFIEVGGHGQNVKYQSSSAVAAQNAESNNVFFFKHSRGLTENFALDFNFDYTMKDSNAQYGSTGLTRALLGGRSSFEAMEMTWVYGGAFIYRPDETALNDGRELAVMASLGFEENVDIALWGLQFDVSTENTSFRRNQSNLVGFFEMPFVTSFNLGLSAGADLVSFSAEQNRNFASLYGVYALDRVSNIQATMKQTNEKSYSLKSSNSELGISLNRVF